LLASQLEDWLISARRRPLVMGVLNMTPDSFSDGGQFASPEVASEFALQMIDSGADWIDIGGESTRPGSSPVSSDEQIRRVVPAIEAIAGRSDTLLSIDTTRAAVAKGACEAGAGLVNDISAGRDDPKMFALAAALGLPIILMHMRGTPKTMQENPVYADVVGEVEQFLIERREAAIAAGVKPDRILFDPGIGFGKTDQHNLELLRATSRLASLGSPLVIGASRKGFIGRITGESAPADRVMGTAAIVGWCAANGAAILRVHDVEQMSGVLGMVRAITGAGI